MATSSPYKVVYSFGDSLADAGNAWRLTNSRAFTTDIPLIGTLNRLVGSAPEPVSPPYATETYAGGIQGHVFSNSTTSVQDISTMLGLGTLAPSGVGLPLSTLQSIADYYAGSSVLGSALVAAIEALPGVKVSGNYVSFVKGANGGRDFAIGGAVTGYTPENGVASQFTDLNSQLATFEHNVRTPSPRALYTVTIGSNDMLNLLEDPNFRTYSRAQVVTAIGESVINEVNFVKSLIAHGAKNILVQDVPDLGKTPEIMDQYPSEVRAASFYSGVYDQALEAQLGQLTGANIQVEDTYGLIDQATANPGEYGLSNVTSPVYFGPFDQYIPTDLVSTDPAVQDQYLFFDMLHPTGTGQTAVADLALSDLGLSTDPPGQVASVGSGVFLGGSSTVSATGSTSTGSDPSGGILDLSKLASLAASDVTPAVLLSQASTETLRQPVAGSTGFLDQFVSDCGMMALAQHQVTSTLT